MKGKGFSGRVIRIEGCYRIVERGAIRGLCSTKEEAFFRAKNYASKKGSEFLIIDDSNRRADEAEKR